MLTLEGVLLTQGDFALRADFTVSGRDKVAVLGPSGAGKSTLLAAIAGFMAPAEGRILWNGTDLAGFEPGQRPVSMVFQDNNLFPHLTVFQNVALGISPGLRLSTGHRDAVTGCLERVGLAGMEARKPGSLSGGQQSRVALARVLVRAKPLLLLDEPFSALGPALKSEMLELVAELAADTEATVLMVTHDPRDALGFADSTILVAEGHAREPRPTAELMHDPPAALTDYLGPMSPERP